MTGLNSGARLLPPGLLDIVVCPACHGKLAIDYDTNELLCTTGACGLAFPVRDGVPVLLIDEARAPERI